MVTSAPCHGLAQLGRVSRALIGRNTAWKTRPWHTDALTYLPAGSDPQPLTCSASRCHDKPGPAAVSRAQGKTEMNILYQAAFSSAALILIAFIASTLAARRTDQDQDTLSESKPPMIPQVFFWLAVLAGLDLAYLVGFALVKQIPDPHNPIFAGFLFLLTISAHITISTIVGGLAGSALIRPRRILGSLGVWMLSLMNAVTVGFIGPRFI